MEALLTPPARAEGAPDADSTTLSVLTLAPEEMVWCGIRLMLGRQPWLETYLIAPSLALAVELAERATPSVALVDIKLDDTSPEEACGAIRAVSPQTRLLLLTTAPQVPGRTVAALGADGFISKSWLSKKVVEAIRCAGFGLESPTTPEAGYGLSGRQMEILELLAEGHTNNEIAGFLKLSRNTVKQHTSAVYRKLAVRNRAAAIGSAQAMGLLS